MILALATREPMKRRPGVGTRREPSGSPPTNPLRESRRPGCAATGLRRRPLLHSRPRNAPTTQKAEARTGRAARAVPEVRDRHGYSLGCRRPAARYAARLPGALLL